MSANQSFTCCFHYLNAHWGFLVIIIFIKLFLPFVHSSVSFSITSFDANANIIYEGDAKPSLGSIELNTIDYSCRVGRAVYYEPIRLWDSSTMTVADFSTHFSFTINTRNITPYGNGFAFFLAPVNHQIPLNSMGGYLGLLNSTSSTNSAASQNHIITVEFDSYVNPDWDPPTEHVGINNNSMRSAVYVPWNAGMYSNLVANVWITYNASATNLSVFWTYDEHPVFEGNSSLSYKIDLMKHLPEWVKIGFSAATGQYAEYNTIKSWEFTSNLDGSPGRRRNRKTYVIVLVAACSVALVFGLAMAAWLLMKRTKSPCKDDDDHPSGFDRVQPVLPIVFPYQELYAATNGFAVDRRFGKGGSAHVYKGELPDKRLVAVKRIFADKKYSFDNELNIASRLKHRNLVPFTGWCHENDELLIVYEFMPNGSLADHLSGKNETILPWHIRYKIVEDLLYGIQYLHKGTEICVIHRDIKPENILLDKYFTARLCDYGIAKLTSLKTTESSTGQGTPGYQAPEYLNQSRARKEADMYSFGIVALEIASGKRSEGDLREWISELHLAGKITDAADGRLQGDYDKDQMERLLKVGLLCTHRSASERPTVVKVIELLKPGTPFPEASLSSPAEDDDDLSENLDDHSLLQMHTSQSDNRRSLELEASENVNPQTLEPRHNTL